MTSFYKGALFAIAGLALAGGTITIQDHLSTLVGAIGFAGAFVLEGLAVRQLRTDRKRLR